MFVRMFGRETIAAVRRAADETAQTAAATREQLDHAVALAEVLTVAALTVAILIVVGLGREIARNV